MPKAKMKSVKRPKTYEKLRKKGLSKSASARIANAGKTKSGRKRMAKKAASTRAKRKS